jgi:glutamine synthetase
VSGQLILSINHNDPGADAKVLTKLGFKQARKTLIVNFTTIKQYSQFLKGLYENFTVPQTHKAGLEYVRTALRGIEGSFREPLRNLNKIGGELSKRLKEYFSSKPQMPSSKKELLPYAVVQDGDLYVMLDLTTQPHALKLKQLVVVPGVTYEANQGAWYMFVASRSNVKKVLTALQLKGVKVVNAAAVLESLRRT